MAENLLYKVAGGKVKEATNGTSQYIRYNTSTGNLEVSGLVIGSLTGVITASSGVVASEAQLALSRGGTNADNSGAGCAPGHVLVGNAGSTAYEGKSISQDLSLTSAGVATVTGLRGRTVAATAPSANQVLKWSGSAWTPQDESGGGGGGGGGVGGGLVYYLNYRDSASSPPAGTWKQMSATFDTDGAINTGAITVTSGGTEVLLASFITEPSVPGAITIPPGVWDINLYGSTNNTSSPADMAYKVYVSKYNGTGFTAIANSDSVVFTIDTLNQYTATVQIPQTTLSSSERIVIQIYGINSDTNNHSITTYFSGTEPSHVHTNISGVGGTGVVKVVAGVLQSPASKIIDSDVDDVGASKITGTLAVANGGTGLSSPGAAGRILVSSGTAYVAQEVSGDATLASTGALTLANTTVTANSYGGTASKTISITVDSKGRITAATEYTIAADLGSVTGTLPVTKGGTGKTTITSGSLLLGNGASTPTELVGTVTGQVVKWNNTSSTWEAGDAPAGGVTSVSNSDGTVTVSPTTGAVVVSIPQSVATSASPTFTGLTVSGLTASKIVKTDASKGLVSADNVSLTSEVTGTLPVGNGGTGRSSVTSGTLLVGAGSSQMTELSGTNGQYVKHNGTTWAAAAGPTIPYDLSSEYVGKPSASLTIMRFVAATAFTLSTTAADHKFKCEVSGTAVLTINKNGSAFATATFTASTSGVVSITNSGLSSISAGDEITVVATSVDSSFSTPYFTLKGTA